MQVFFVKKKTRRKRKRKGTFLPFWGLTNKKHMFFFKKRDSTNGTNSKNNMAFCETGEYVTGENEKREKRWSNQTESSKKKSIHKMGATEEKHSWTRTKKKHVHKQMRTNQKVKNRSKEEGQTCKNK